MPTQIVIVAQSSPELEVALDALDDFRSDVRLFSRPSEAAKALISSAGPAGAELTAVVLIEVRDPSPAVADLVAGLRGELATAQMPIVLWGPTEACEALQIRNGDRPNSYVRTGSDPRANAAVLAQTIHYWAVVNQPPDSPPKTQDLGDRT